MPVSDEPNPSVILRISPAWDLGNLDRHDRETRDRLLFELFAGIFRGLKVAVLDRHRPGTSTCPFEIARGNAVAA